MTPAEQFIRDVMVSTYQNPFNNRERVFDDNSAAVHVALKSYDGVLLMMIRSLFRRTGRGSVALDRLCDLADRHRVTIYGFICAAGRQKPRLTDRQLRKWYQSRGFKVRSDWYMKREPKGLDKIASTR